MYLLADIGNTCAKLAMHDGKRFTASQTLECPVHRRLFEEGLGNMHASLAEIETAYVASVNPACGQYLVELLKSRDCEVLFPRHNLRIPIQIRIKNPELIGVDRLLNASAAYERLGKALAVVSFGTATVCDLVSTKGEFLGGTIAPGASMGAWALHARTALLPEVPVARPHSIPGKDTEEAIRAGVYWSTVGAVRHIIDIYSSRIGKRLSVVATGGMAEVFADDIPEITAVAPDLTLEGLCLVAGLPISATPKKKPKLKPLAKALVH